MKVSEVNKILTSKNMQDKETNFKLKTKRPGGGGNGPRKPPKYFADFKDEMLGFIKEQRSFNKQILLFIQEQRKFNIETNKKFEYIFDVFKRNNLK